MLHLQVAILHVASTAPLVCAVNAQLDVRKRAAGAAPAVSSSNWAQLARWLANGAVWRDSHTVQSVYHFKGVSPTTLAKLGSEIVRAAVISVSASQWEDDERTEIGANVG